MLVIWPSSALIFSVAEPIIKGAEGLRLKSYPCPAGKWTIGWGCTLQPNGQPVEPGMVITALLAEVYLQASMARELALLERPGIVTRSPNLNQAAAFLDLTYNIGVGVHDGKKGDFADSDIVLNFNAGNDNEAANHFLDWDKAHVRGALMVLPGLVTRRTTEKALFLKAA